MTRSSKQGWTRRQVLAAAIGAGSTLSVAGCIEQPRAERSTDEPNTTTSTRQSESGGTSAWPQFGFDARNTGHAPSAAGPATNPEVRWRFDAKTPTMNTSPVVADGTVYVAGSGDPGYVYAVDAETGESEWQFEPAGYVSSTPALVDDVLYFGTWGKRFYAIDATTGEERWSTDVGHRFGSSAPVVVDGTIYVGTIGDGPLAVSGPEDEEKFQACALLALDADTGEERWRYDEFGEKDDIASSPAVANGRVHFAGEKAVYALDTETGDVVWQRAVGMHPESSPAVANGLAYYGGPLGGDGETPAQVWALDAKTGETVWTADVDDSSLRTSPAVANGTVYVPASSTRGCFGGGGDDSNCSGVTRGRLYAFDAASGDRQWHAPIKTDTRSSPAVADGTIYVGCRDGLSAVTVDGESTWRVSFESDREDGPYVKSSPAVSDGTAFIGASDGRLRAITER